MPSAPRILPTRHPIRRPRPTTRSGWTTSTPAAATRDGHRAVRPRMPHYYRRVPSPENVRPHPYSPEGVENLFGKTGWVPNRGSESGQEGSKESRSAISLAPRSTAETPLAIFQTVSEGEFSEVRPESPSPSSLAGDRSARGS